MKKIICGLTGTTSLLMNSPKGMLEPKENKLVKKTEQRDRKEDAENVCYRTSKGNLFVPSTAVKGCLINAASYKKVGRYALKPLIAGGVRIGTEEIEIRDKPKGKILKDYEIDLRTVVIKQARVLKARPKLAKWYLEFEIAYNENLIGDDKIIKEVLAEGGERVGLLDFSPRNKGDFGCFVVSKWEALK